MNESSTNAHDVYFAAANGYSGFRSYFGDVFDSEDFSKIYVLKGGPGTGKSTLMKKVRSHFEKSTLTESILCSSDINSLDGIIIEHKGIKCAMLDGTAPHERDAVIPGAIDEIINLGEGWNSDFLSSKREDILLINKIKKRNYALAYRMLALAGYIDKEAEHILYNATDLKKAELLAENIIEIHPCETVSFTKIKLRSCFGKGGYQSLLNENKNSIRLFGNYNSGNIVMNILDKKLSEQKKIKARFPMPLSASQTEYLETSNTAFSITDDTGDFDCSSILSNIRSIDKEHLEKTEKIKKEFLFSSQKYFELASLEHFKLEDIYKDAMNFDNNENVYNKIIAEFEKKLEI